MRANTELKPYGKVTTTVSLSVLESCPLVVELRSRGLTPYEPVKVLQPDLKRLIANEYRRGVLPASVIGSLVGISESRVYSYVKKVKKNESYSFQKTPTNFENRRGSKREEGRSDASSITEPDAPASAARAGPESRQVEGEPPDTSAPDSDSDSDSADEGRDTESM